MLRSHVFREELSLQALRNALLLLVANKIMARARHCSQSIQYRRESCLFRYVQALLTEPSALTSPQSMRTRIIHGIILRFHGMLSHNPFAPDKLRLKMRIVQSVETPLILSPNTLRLFFLPSRCHEFHLEHEHAVLLWFPFPVLRCIYLLAAHRTCLLLGSSMQGLVQTQRAK
jgi:hypothetical protein